MNRFPLRPHAGRARIVASLLAGLCIARSGNGQTSTAEAEARLRVVDYKPSLILPLTGSSVTTFILSLLRTNAS